MGEYVPSSVLSKSLRIALCGIAVSFTVEPPEPIVPAPVRDGLRGDGFEVFAFAPRKFEASDVDHASPVVSFDQELAETVGARARYVEWGDLPGVLTDYTRGRDEILRHVDELINELAGRDGP
jgi:hypothetical protein